MQMYYTCTVTVCKLGKQLLHAQQVTHVAFSSNEHTFNPSRISAHSCFKIIFDDTCAIFIPLKTNQNRIFFKPKNKDTRLDAEI